MSLPRPGTGGTSSAFAKMSLSEQEEWDAPLIALAQRSGGDLRRLLYAFFSFLCRRTDFYMVMPSGQAATGAGKTMGFREGDAEKMLLAAFRQFPLRRVPTKEKMQEYEQQRKDKINKEKQSPALVTEQQKPASPSSTTKSEAKPKIDISKKSHLDVKRTEEGKQIPVGNGGTTPRYQWTQTIHEASVVVPVPPGTKGKDLDVSIRSTSVSVRLKNSKNPPILEGTLTNKVRTDESTWTIEGGALLITLDKVQHTWWETVIQGDEQIDTSLVDSTRRIDEYDQATQAAIRKALFDENQTRKGLPTSDQILGKDPQVPPLPTGVEYIDKDTLEDAGAAHGQHGDKPP